MILAYSCVMDPNVDTRINALGVFGGKVLVQFLVATKRSIRLPRSVFQNLWGEMLILLATIARVC